MDFRKIGLGLSLALVASTLSAQAVYRWTDANGRVQYSDQPPPPGAKDASERNVKGSSIQNNEVSLASSDAQKKSPVVLYVSECGDSCDSAKGYLNKRGIPHTVVDPTRSAELNKKFREETGSNSLPVLKVGERKLMGWSESNWASALDTAGYPKTPPFAKPKPLEDLTGIDTGKKDAAKKDAPKTPDNQKAPPKTNS
jgi:glutaredoxin